MITQKKSQKTYQHPDFSYTTAWDNGFNCKPTSFSYTFYVWLDIGFYGRLKNHFWKGKLAKSWMTMPSVAKQCHHANFLFKIQFFNPFYHAASLCTRMYQQTGMSLMLLLRSETN